MSAESPPAFLQAGSYGAEQTRRAIASLLARGSSIGSVLGGLVGSTDCALSPPGSGMSVTVAPGELWVPGTTSSTQSGYYCRVSSSTSLSIAVSDPTNPRIDTVIAQVQDAAYAGSNNTFAPAVVTGSPASGATLSNLLGKGSVPASSLVLGYVLVPANATNIVGGDLLNVASVATFGLGGSTVGFTNIATAQSTASTTFTTLTTPDEVTNLVLTTEGIIRVWFQALHYCEATGGSPVGGEAAVFLNGNQVQIQGYDGTTHGPVPQYAPLQVNTSADFGPLFSSNIGLVCFDSATNYNADLTTGQIIGGAPIADSEFLNVGYGGELAEVGYAGSVSSNLGSSYTPGSNPGFVGGSMEIFAAAGTYTVSVQFKAVNSSTGVHAQGRKLFVQAISF